MTAYKIAMGIATGAQWLFNTAMSVGLLPVLAIMAAVGLFIAIV